MASIRHRVRADGIASWQVRFRRGGRATNQESVTFATERGAREFAKLVDDLGAQTALDILAAREGAAGSDVPTLGDWAREHVDSLTGVTEGTRGRYRRLIDTRLAPLAALPVDAVTAGQIARWVNALEREGLSGKTMSNLHGFLSSVMKGAIKAGRIAANPCEGTRLPKTERGEMVFLTGSEFAHLLAHVPPVGHDLVALLPATGLRFGEATALQARDIDLEAGTLTVSRAWKYVENGPPVLGAPKTRRSLRTIPVPPAVLDILAERVSTRMPEDFLFTNTAGRPWSRGRFHTTVWQPAVRAARSKALHDPRDDDRVCQVPPLGKRPRVHDMRHACASWMIKAHVPLPVIQRHLGHESIQTTIDLYGHLEPTTMALAAGALGAELGQAFPQIEP